MSLQTNPETDPTEDSGGKADPDATGTASPPQPAATEPGTSHLGTPGTDPDSTGATSPEVDGVENTDQDEDADQTTTDQTATDAETRTDDQTTDQTGTDAQAAEAPVACSACGAAVPAITFCEECGDRLDGEKGGDDLTPARGVSLACPHCGGTSFSDGYCDQCGGRAPQVRDHLEEAPTAWVAGVCDRGVTHARNEDSQAMVASAEPGQFAALVVCDGVSSVPRSDEASQAAAKAAVAALDPPLDFEAPSPPETDWSVLIPAAARAANDAVAQVAGPDELSGRNCPSCTFVTAVVDSGRIAAASVGDSRAYWLPDSGTASSLTTDDSWAQEMIGAGMTREQAERAPQAHAITRWLGPDAPPVDPPVACYEPDGPGWLCVCSDGLWNYCSEADDLSGLVHEQASNNDDDPLRTARALVDWVNARGGRDNVTVVLARLGSSNR